MIRLSHSRDFVLPWCVGLWRSFQQCLLQLTFLNKRQKSVETSCNKKRRTFLKLSYCSFLPAQLYLQRSENTIAGKGEGVRARPTTWDMKKGPMTSALAQHFPIYVMHETTNSSKGWSYEIVDGHFENTLEPKIFYSTDEASHISNKCFMV